MFFFLPRCSNDPPILCSTLQHEKISKSNTHILGTFPFGSWIFYFYLKASVTWNVYLYLRRNQNDKKIFLSANMLCVCERERKRERERERTWIYDPIQHMIVKRKLPQSYTCTCEKLIKPKKTYLIIRVRFKHNLDLI